MANKIKFHAKQEVLDAYPHPFPSAKALPEWFKALPSSTNPHPRSSSVKRCIPFLEACSEGFIIPFYCDVWVTAQNGNIDFEFSEKHLCDGMSPHAIEQVEGHPFESLPYGTIPLKFHNPWVIETPKNYSCYFMSPLNRMEKRFKLFDGVVDTDRYYNNINFPFIWTGGDGEFLIEKGTPLVQVIPFKRDVFKREVGLVDEKRLNRDKFKLLTFFRDAYRRLFWHKMEQKK
ncbi:putative Deoxyuridine 5'-triphosphate nucleotidohydrolase [uncultured Mediterranean phage uvMED]|nr:putative Deoxyuridine 5'-triphosphate nucleotidohydrolase [uncultured Mediterranean phage uvMED]